MPGLPTRQILYIFIGIVLLFHLHASFPEWEELPIVRYVHHHLKHACQGGSTWAHCTKAQGDKEKMKKVKTVMEDPELIWDNIPPRSTLFWKSCYPGTPIRYQCARLLVPLDYSAPEGAQAAIALIRIPSPLSRSSKEYKGPILFNPGGPGGSGVDLILAAGGLFRTILGDGFDLVGFDPRGVSRSLPFISAFGSPLERFIHLSRQSVYSIINTSTNSIAELVAGARLISQLAETTDMNGYLEHINTDHTARDMLSIIKAHGTDKLQYWGFSYGSVLGATFASLFPDNVGRIVIDGVVDGEDYYSTSWTTNLLDTDKTLQTFFDSCYSAGPSDCAFYAPSPAAIAKNLTQIYDFFKTHPFPAVSSQSGIYAVIDYNFLRGLIFTSLYQPYATFPRLAVGLAALANGDVPFFWNTMRTGGGGLYDEIDLADRVAMRAVYGGIDPLDRIGEAGIATACNDGKLIPGTTEDTEAHFEKLKKISEWADVWTAVRTGCSGWPDFPKRFRGPLGGNTSFPMLLIGNTADPVTPLWAAKKMSKVFPGSVVLTQDSPGHCSISGPSVCTMLHVRAYFEQGTLPHEGTVCPVLAPPIPGGNARSRGIREALARSGQGVLNDEDRILVDAVVRLSETYSLPRFL